MRVKRREEQHKLLTTVRMYTERLFFFFIVNVTEREFLFLILVGETFFFCLVTRVAIFATAFFYCDLEKTERRWLKKGEMTSLETTTKTKKENWWLAQTAS